MTDPRSVGCLNLRCPPLPPGTRTNPAWPHSATSCRIFRGTQKRMPYQRSLFQRAKMMSVAPTTGGIREHGPCSDGPSRRSPRILSRSGRNRAMAALEVADRVFGYRPRMPGRSAAGDRPGSEAPGRHASGFIKIRVADSLEPSWRRTGRGPSAAPRLRTHTSPRRRDDVVERPHLDGLRA